MFYFSFNIVGKIVKKNQMFSNLCNVNLTWILNIFLRVNIWTNLDHCHESNLVIQSIQVFFHWFPTGLRRSFHHQQTHS